MNTSTGTKQPLDEVMLAMDVVDTLRRRQRLVDRELGEASRRMDLRDHLREIYASQGIEVPDHIIDEGVKALAEDRFVFDPPDNSFGVRLARLYVNRLRWGKFLGAAVVVILAAIVLNYLLVTRPNAALTTDLDAAYAGIGELTQSESARSTAEDLYFAGKTSLESGQTSDARAALAALENLGTALGQSYEIRIVNVPGENTAVWRVPDVNQGARNYYAIVQAVDATGRAVDVAITNEETGVTQTVSRWGLRIDAATFDKIANDKLDDGILQDDLFGVKERGVASPDYAFPTTGGAITKW